MNTKSEQPNSVSLGVGLLVLTGLLVSGVLVGPQLPGPEDASIALPTVLLIGLTAGGLSCLAVQGGLLAVAVTGTRDPGGEAQQGLAERVSPTLWFLAAKLVSYTLLGAALGALSEAASPSPTLRAVILVGSSLLMLGTALYFLGVHPIFRYAVIQPPRFLTRKIQATARGSGRFTPAVLGAMTIFLPCGVTQAMQLVAINSGSPLTGAAIMAVFVLGTTPLFVSLGVFATTLSGSAQARFLKVAGVAILFVGILSLNAGLRLAGSPVTLATLKDQVIAEPTPVPAVAAPDGRQEVSITATSDGYKPKVAQVKAGEPAKIVFTSDGSQGCWISLLFEGEQFMLSSRATTIDLPPMPAGKAINYSCTMGMASGKIEVIA